MAVPIAISVGGVIFMLVFLCALRRERMRRQGRLVYLVEFTRPVKAQRRQLAGVFEIRSPRPRAAKARRPS